ncbi:hypothetical protein ACFL2V_10360 [Pseudomonadota bacterium]
MHTYKKILFPLIIACLFPLAALAQPPTAPENEHPSTIGTMPTRGMTMEQVKKHFGEPDKVVKPVGEPPITRWIYDGFIVYFERKYVLHALMPSNGN